jgi:hypothetical protein
MIKDNIRYGKKRMNKMRNFLFGLFLIGCLNLIVGCDLSILDTPPTTIFYDVGYYPCCDYGYDVVYYYKAKN